MKKLDNFKSAAIYEKPKLTKKQIMQENKGKSGIYKWTNKINGKIYIGSAVNIPKRLSHYFSEKYMETHLKKVKSAIYSSMIKYGISKFNSFYPPPQGVALGDKEILEYCSPEKCIKIEQHFINLFQAEYNILQIAGAQAPSLGFNHSDKTRAKMSADRKGIQKSEETRAKMSASKMANSNGKNHPNSLKIQVTDIEFNSSTLYNSMNEAARALNIPQSRISLYFKNNQKKPYKGRYLFNKID